MKRLRHARRLNMSRWIALIAFLFVSSPTAPVTAHEIDVPLRFDAAFIRQALLEQLYTGPNDTAVVWDTGTGCGYLKLREPSVNGAGTRLRVVTRGEARVGTLIGSMCLAPLQWDGFIEVFEEVLITPD